MNQKKKKKITNPIYVHQYLLELTFLTPVSSHSEAAVHRLLRLVTQPNNDFRLDS